MDISMMVPHVKKLTNKQKLKQKNYSEIQVDHLDIYGNATDCVHIYNYYRFSQNNQAKGSN